MAADRVKEWVSRRFIVNESQRDRRGWDHYYEFYVPSPDDPKLPPGMPFAALSCKVQVKGTRNPTSLIRVSLNNLVRFAQEPIPCFIIVLRFDRKSDETKDVYLIHVWKEVISQVLDRICHLDPKEKRRLHKKSLSLSLDPRNKLLPPWADSVRERIATCIGSDLYDYAHRKRALYESVGFTEVNRELKISVQAPSKEEMYDRLSKLAIGLEAMEFIRFEAAQIRFGVTFPDQTMNAGQSGLLRIQPTDRDRSWTLRVSEGDQSNAIEFKCVVRSSAQAFPFLPEPYWLLRIETSLLDLIIRVASQQLTFSFTPPAFHYRLSLEEWHHTCKLLERLCSASTEKVSFRISANEEKARQFEFSIARPSVSLINENRELIKIVEATWRVCNNLELDGQTKVSLTDLKSIYPEVFLLECAVSHLTVLIEAEVPGQISISSKSAGVTFPNMRFGDSHYVFAVAVLGFPSIERLESGNTKLIIESSDVTVLQQWKLRPEDAETFSVDAVVASATRLLNERGIEDIFFVRWIELRKIPSAHTLQEF